LTGDPDFKDEKLKAEFFQITGKELSIVEEVSDLKGKLEEEIKGTEIINKALEKIHPNLLNSLQSMINKNYSEIISKGNLYQISDIIDYRILDINLSEKVYILSLLVYFEHESIYALYAKHGAFDREYINDKEISQAEITLFFDEDYNLKEISSEETLFNGQNKLEFKQK